MSEPAKSLVVTLSVDELRVIVRQEVEAALGNGNGHGPDRLMDVPDVAEYIKQSQDYVYRHWKQMNGRKLGNKSIRFTRADLDKWLKTRQKPS